MMAWGNPQVILGGARPLANHQSTMIYHLYPVLSTYLCLVVSQYVHDQNNNDYIIMNFRGLEHCSNG